MYGYNYGGSWSPPYTADQICAYNGAYNPAGVHLDSYTLAYFKRDLYQRVAYFLEWIGMPDHWLLDYVNACLVFNGYCGVLNTDEYGTIPQWGTLSGWGIYQEPNRLSVVSTYIQRPLMLIGEECELLRLTSDLRGLQDVIDFYAVKLALVSRDFDMSAVQSTVSWAVAAKTPAAAQAIKAAYDEAQAGKPLVVMDRKQIVGWDKEYPDKDPWYTFSRDVHEGLILEETLDAMDRLYHQFYTVVGIPFANTRQERTVTLQAAQDAAGTESRVQQMIDTLSRSCDRVNEMFGLNLSVKMRGGDLVDAADPDTEQPAPVR